MTDIVERLRQYVSHGGKVYESDAEEAADEIERLRAVLRDIATDKYRNYVQATLAARDALRATDHPAGDANA